MDSTIIKRTALKFEKYDFIGRNLYFHKFSKEHLSEVELVRNNKCLFCDETLGVKYPGDNIALIIQVIDLFSVSESDVVGTGGGLTICKNCYKDEDLENKIKGMLQLNVSVIKGLSSCK